MSQKTRAVVYLGPEQHAKIAAIQEELKLSSAAEAHRLAIDRFEAHGDQDDLDALVEALRKSNREVGASLKEAKTEIRKTLRYFRALGKN